MHGETSRLSDRVSRDSLAPRLRDSGEDAWRIGNELFSFAKLLDGNVRIERALTEPSRPADDKTALLRSLIGDQAHPVTMEVLADLAARRWSRVKDVADGVEDFGVDAMMYFADATDATLRVSVELAQLHSALLNLSTVRSGLDDPKVPSQTRVDLLRRLLEGKKLNRITLRLAEHATCNLRNRRYLATIQWMINKFSRHMGESTITVTTAVPLTRGQVDRLVSLYTARLGGAAHVNSVVDPGVLGGMRIQVGDEVIDNTVAAQLGHLRRAVASNAVPHGLRPQRPVPDSCDCKE